MPQDRGRPHAHGNGSFSKDSKRKRNHSPSHGSNHKKFRKDDTTSLGAYARSIAEGPVPPGTFHNRNHYHQEKPVLQPKAERAPADSNAYLKEMLEEIIDGDAGLPPDKSDAAAHAKALYATLFLRPRELSRSPAQVELDNILPAQGPSPIIPPDEPRRPCVPGATASLPPLPPIKEYFLEYATFRHVSVNDGGPPKGKAEKESITYEKLEWLGDAYLELIATRIVYARFPHLQSGQQSQVRELMVKNDTLAGYSRAYGFHDRIAHHYSDGSDSKWSKIHADVFEAYVAAIIQADPEHGFSRAEAWLGALWAPLLLKAGKGAPIDTEFVGAKIELAKLIHYKGIKIDYKPDRPMEMIGGKQRYHIGCYLTGWGYENRHLGSGSAQNKVEAGAAAAVDALKRSQDVIRDAMKKKLEAIPVASVPGVSAEATKQSEPVDGTEKTENESAQETKTQSKPVEDTKKTQSELTKEIKKTENGETRGVEKARKSKKKEREALG